MDDIHRKKLEELGFGSLDDALGWLEDNEDDEQLKKKAIKTKKIVDEIFDERDRRIDVLVKNASRELIDERLYEFFEDCDFEYIDELYDDFVNKGIKP